MRKTIIASDGFQVTDQLATKQLWLNLDRLARVEISSEDASYPVEQALSLQEHADEPAKLNDHDGWRAGLFGPQTMHVHFDQPQTIKRVMLHFCEAQQERSQEFSLHATTTDGRRREIVRQQWSFSPAGSTSETENYEVNIENVRTLTLWIDPDRGRDRYKATLAAFRIEG